jgi:hypothetical protein
MPRVRKGPHDVCHGSQKGTQDVRQRSQKGPMIYVTGPKKVHCSPIFSASWTLFQVDGGEAVDRYIADWRVNQLDAHFAACAARAARRQIPTAAATAPATFHTGPPAIVCTPAYQCLHLDT